jgi:hypothetical protein
MSMAAGSYSSTLEQRMRAAARKLEREQAAIAALHEDQAGKARVDANTLRLRALRLAKEAADAKVVAEPPAQPRKRAHAERCGVPGRSPRSAEAPN